MWHVLQHKGSLDNDYMSKLWAIDPGCTSLHLLLTLQTASITISIYLQDSIIWMWVALTLLSGWSHGAKLFILSLLMFAQHGNLTLYKSCTQTCSHYIRSKWSLLNSPPLPFKAFICIMNQWVMEVGDKIHLILHQPLSTLNDIAICSSHCRAQQHWEQIE